MGTFYIGQQFNRPVPPEVAAWCNANNCRIVKEGKIRSIVKNPNPPSPTTDEIIKVYEDAVQYHLDKTAQSRDYDNTYTCLSYLSSTDEVWCRESNAFNAWRDQVWRKCHEILNSVMNGTIQQPTVEDLISQLPVIDWNDPKEENNSENI